MCRFVVDALRASPHAENTYVVLWSDHDFHLGEKHHWAKRTLWEESTRVQFISGRVSYLIRSRANSR